MEEGRANFDVGAVQFEKHLQKNQLSVPFLKAVLGAFEYMAGDSEEGKSAHRVAFKDYFCCW